MGVVYSAGMSCELCFDLVFNLKQPAVYFSW